MQRLTLLSVLLLLAAAGVAAQEQPAAEGNKWETTITRFEAKDKEHAPEKGGVLFVGSSSIVGWDLEKSFPDLHALNRGFGGSVVADVLHFFDRVVTPYAPKTIVFYSGDNDIASGLAPEAVVADYQAFVKRVHEALPETRVILLGIKPSNARWELWEKMQAVNTKLQDLAAKDELVAYVDTAAPLLGADGKPRAELFKQDGLHLNEAGYATWTLLVEAVLAE